MTAPAGVLPMCQMLLKAPESPAPRVTLVPGRALALANAVPRPAHSAPLARFATEPAAFRPKASLATLTGFHFESVDTSLRALVETQSHSPCVEPVVLAPRFQEVRATATPSNGANPSLTDAKPSLAAASSLLKLAEAMPLADYRTLALTAVRPAAQPAFRPEHISVLRAPVLPKAALSPAPAMKAEAGQTESRSCPAVVPAVVPAFAALRPVPVTPVGAAAAAAMLPGTDALPFPSPAMVRPELQPVVGQLALKSREPMPEEVLGADILRDRVAELHGPSLASSSVLPALASLFRYGRAPRENAPLPHLSHIVTAQNRRASPAAYMEMPMPARRPLVPKSSGLRIVETFEYLRPMQKESAFDLIAPLLQLWRTAPAYLRYAAVSACVILLLVGAGPGGMFNDVVASRWDSLREGIDQRAAVELTEGFQDGMSDWGGQGDWAQSWRLSKAGYVKPGRLAIYQPSIQMREYSVEFMMQIEQRAVGFAYRATDQENYYAAKISIARPGPMPELSLIRYPVIGGKQGPKVEIPIRVLLHNNTPYRVQLDVKGNGYSTSIEGQLVDFWSDDRLKIGGFGFFSDTGESARVYWMKLANQNDFIGRICAYARATDVDRKRSPRLPQ